MTDTFTQSLLLQSGSVSGPHLSLESGQKSRSGPSCSQSRLRAGRGALSGLWPPSSYPAQTPAASAACVHVTQVCKGPGSAGCAGCAADLDRLTGFHDQSAAWQSPHWQQQTGAQALDKRKGCTWNRLVAKTTKSPLARDVSLTPARTLKVKCTSAKQVWPDGQAVSSAPAACCTAWAGVSTTAASTEHRSL